MKSGRTGERPVGALALAVISLAAGSACGVVAVLFRLCLNQGDRWRGVFVGWAQGEGVAGLALVVAAVATAAALAAWLVRRFAPEAAGSGIPSVEVIARQGGTIERPARLMLVKFTGGVLAIAGGLALGREGPTVQMGACAAQLFGNRLGLGDGDRRALVAAGAGAGLAAAFNAPIAGAAFVLEELLGRFDKRTSIAALGASGGAILVVRVCLGDRPDFDVESQLMSFSNAALPLHLLLGGLAGLAGAAYCRTIVGLMALADRLAWLPVEFRAAVIGAAVGALAWVAPTAVGGGDPLVQDLLVGGAMAVSALIVWFAVRFVLGAVSYAALTPGGLFAPMLVLGAQTGVFFNAVAGVVVPGMASTPVVFAITGMAALFAASVRAPLTGIILIAEITGGGSALLLPMLVACCSAMVVPTALGVLPIYDSLKRGRTPPGEGPEDRSG